jgi:hypothetical protein
MRVARNVNIYWRGHVPFVVGSRPGARAIHVEENRALDSVISVFCPVKVVAKRSVAQAR